MGQRHREINIKQIYFEVIDWIVAEFKTRFEENNQILLALLAANNQANIDISHQDYIDFNYNELEPLKEIGLKIPSDGELKLVKEYLQRTKTEENSLQTIMKRLQPVKLAFHTTFKFFAAVETFGNSTTINEASFSTLNRVDTKFRFSSTNERLRDLTFLAFEKKMFEKVEDENIMREFVEKSPRRIRLF